MREIKFRAWDIKEKRMLNWDKEPYLSFFIGDYGVILKNAFDKSNLNSGGKVELMQFTGLKDKNGVEIWEGDIVKTKDKYYPIKVVSYTATIINEHDGDWDEWYCGFDLTLAGGEYSVLHYRLSADDIKVIGNIYENPELLK
jgi:uncharacterized phage protein (TIGR01671 family)